MKRIRTSALVPGMITAEDVYTYNNQLILPKGLILTDKAITKLEFYSIINVLVEDTIVDAPGIVSGAAPSYLKRLKESEEFQSFKQSFDSEIDTFRSSINDVVIRNAPLNLDVMLDQTLELINTQTTTIHIFDMLHNMRQYDDVTYVHSVNVALICNLFARWLHMSDDDINTATLCGLLHDLGKILIPEDIIRKPAKLSVHEYEIIKSHPQEGCRVLSAYSIDEHIKNAALMHHERCDGSGYPSGLTDRQIDPFAKIVAIADVYDAMTSARIYRGPMCPFQVIEIFESEGFQKYDIRNVLIFLQNVVNTYLQNNVRLSNGLEGEVIYINPSYLSRPTVKCGSRYIDLAVEKNISIEALV